MCIIELDLLATADSGSDAHFGLPLLCFLTGHVLLFSQDTPGDCMLFVPGASGITELEKNLLAQTIFKQVFRVISLQIYLFLSLKVDQDGEYITMQNQIKVD